MSSLVQTCWCGRGITIAAANGGLSIDILHPAPPCDQFRDFVEKLVASGAECSGVQELATELAIAIAAAPRELGDAPAARC